MPFMRCDEAIDEGGEIVGFGVDWGVSFMAATAPIGFSRARSDPVAVKESSFEGGAILEPGCALPSMVGMAGGSIRGEEMPDHSPPS